MHSALPLTDLSGGEIDALIQSYMAASDDNNATFQALKSWFAPERYTARSIRFPFRPNGSGDVSVLKMKAVFLSGLRKG